MLSSVEVREGDVVLLATDGFFYNMYDAEVAQVIKEMKVLAVILFIHVYFGTSLVPRPQILSHIHGCEIKSGQRPGNEATLGWDRDGSYKHCYLSSGQSREGLV